MSPTGYQVKYGISGEKAVAKGVKVFNCYVYML